MRVGVHDLVWLGGGRVARSGGAPVSGWASVTTTNVRAGWTASTPRADVGVSVHFDQLAATEPTAGWWWRHQYRGCRCPLGGLL